MSAFDVSRAVTISSYQHSLDLIQADGVVGAVIQLRRAGRLMVRSLGYQTPAEFAARWQLERARDLEL